MHQLNEHSHLRWEPLDEQLDVALGVGPLCRYRALEHDRVARYVEAYVVLAAAAGGGGRAPVVPAPHLPRPQPGQPVLQPGHDANVEAVQPGQGRGPLGARRLPPRLADVKLDGGAVGRGLLALSVGAGADGAAGGLEVGVDVAVQGDLEDVKARGHLA